MRVELNFFGIDSMAHKKGELLLLSERGMCSSSLCVILYHIDPSEFEGILGIK